MTTTTFGSGDYGSYNDWAFRQGAFYTTWNTTQYGPDFGRVTALAARWDAYNGLAPGTASGRNILWRATTNLLSAHSGTITGTSRGAGSTETMHNSTCTDFWQTGTHNYFLGFSLGSGDSFIIAWKDGSHGGYSGKSAGSANNTGGTAHWGTSADGGLPVFGTVALSSFYVKRSGVMVRVFEGTRRSGVWDNNNYIRVRRSGSWTIVNWLQEGERHIPPEGMSVEIDVGEGWESGWMVEEGEMGWFGSNPTGRGFDWMKPGDYDWPYRAWDGRYKSSDSEEIAEQRLLAQYKWDRALREERYQEAKLWNVKFQPQTIIQDIESESILVAA